MLNPALLQRMTTRSAPSSYRGANRAATKNPPSWWIKSHRLTIQNEPLWHPHPESHNAITTPPTQTQARGVRQPDRLPMPKASKTSTSNPPSPRGAVRQLGRRRRHPHHSATALGHPACRLGSPSRRQVSLSSAVSGLNRSRMVRSTRTGIRRQGHPHFHPLVRSHPEAASDPPSRRLCCGEERDWSQSCWQLV